MQTVRVDVWEPVLVASPTPQRKRVRTPIQEQQVRTQTQSWLAAGIVERIPFPAWHNNIVIAAKKDGTPRICIDCTPANDVTEDFDWPLPRLQDLRSFVRGSQHFARIDLKDAFLRIGGPAKYRHLTAYEVDGVAYQYK